MSQKQKDMFREQELTEIGEAILEQLTVDDRRIRQVQNIRQSSDKQFLSPCGIYVAISLMRELHPEFIFEEDVVMSSSDQNGGNGGTAKKNGCLFLCVPDLRREASLILVNLDDHSEVVVKSLELGAD